MNEALCWVHPVGGALAVGLVVWLGLQGVRSRHRARYAAQARARHGRLAMGIYLYVLAVGAAGIGTVLALRPELDPASSPHFVLMLLLAGLLSGGAVTSRRFAGRPELRGVHRQIGVAGMVLALAGAALGLGLLPG